MASSDAYGTDFPCTSDRPVTNSPSGFRNPSAARPFVGAKQTKNLAWLRSETCQGETFTLLRPQTPAEQGGNIQIGIFSYHSDRISHRILLETGPDHPGGEAKNYLHSDHRVYGPVVNQPLHRRDRGCRAHLHESQNRSGSAGASFDPERSSSAGGGSSSASSHGILAIAAQRRVRWPGRGSGC